MAGIVYIKLLDALEGIGINVSKTEGSNVQKLFTKNKSTATKPGLLAAERDRGGNFATVLDVFKDEAKYIDSMNDAEQIAFLNNILDYNEFGGKSIKTSEGIKALDEAKKLTDDAKDLKTSIEDLTGVAKTMKDEAEAAKNKAWQDIKDFMETGGQPLKKKDDKFLGGSMHEEGQLRTAIRQFLTTELDKGRLKLNSKDTHRVRNYYPTIEDDPILVFKRVYGDDAYKKAGSFPGAFEIGEDFKHYEKIFRENMGEDLLKVKNKDHVGDGTLVLDESLTYKEPIDDPDIPFAKGGRASFVGGKFVDEIVALIVKKEPIEAMKEVNKVIGKKGKYKNLTQKDIDRIVNQTDDWIFQRDPDNLYVYDDGKTIYDDDLTKEQLIEKEGRKYDQENIASSSEEAKLQKYGKKEFEYDDPNSIYYDERRVLKEKYPGISDELLDNILIDDNAQRKAEVLATIDEAFIMAGKGKGPNEIIEILKNTSRTKNSKGGRAGYYMGGQSTIEPDLSDIGHGSDSLMSRNRILAPNNQATTSTGLNYLLGEDNDNTRVPFNSGKTVLPQPKPYTLDQFEKDSMLYLKGMYGTGPESNTMFYNKIIEKGNDLRKQGVERETVIEIIRKNKDKINAFLETQTTSPKTFKGMADGGRIGYKDKGKVSLSDLESLKGLKKEREKLNIEPGLMGLAGKPMGQTARSQRAKILDKAIAKFAYAVDNLDQETREKVISAFNNQLKIGYETTMSGLKMDAAEKAGFVPIDKETIYKAILNMDLPKETKLEMKTLSDAAGNEELEFSLVNNNLGITYDNQSQTIVGEYRFDTKDGKLSITPSITKDEDSKIQSKIEIDKAINNGSIDLDLTKDTTDNSLTTDFEIVKDGNVLSATNVTGGDNNYFTAEGTAKVPFYMLKDGQSPYISSEYYKDDGSNYFETSLGIPITQNLEASLSNLNRYDGSHVNTLGVNYKKYIDNIFTKNKSLDTRGTFSFDANIDSDNNKYAGFEVAFPLGGKKTRNMEGINFNNYTIQPSQRENYVWINGELVFMPEQEQLEYKISQNNNKNNIYSGSDFNELIKATKDNFTLSDFIGPVQELASGGIAGLRPGFAGGTLVDKGRRGFLKFLGGTAAGVAALKAGLVKLLGKDSGAISKKVIDEVIIDGGSGAPPWLQPLVNKALREGTDKTKGLAYKDAQVVKSLDTPTGNVDVYYDVRTGEVEIDYIGGNTALGESVNMRYTPGIADEGTKGKPADTFEATESIPEYQGGNPLDGPSLEIGENTTDNVKNLFSDVSELQALGGKKELINDISITLKKKKVLKKMQDNPGDFATDVQGDYVPD